MSKIRALNAGSLQRDVRFSGSGSGSGGPNAWVRWPGYNEPHILRFLPPYGDTDQIWVPHCTHYKQIGENRGGWEGLDGSGRARAITCNEYHDQGSCPVCELVRYCEERGQDVKGIKAKVQWLTNVIFDGEVQVWGSTPVSVIEELIALADSKHFGLKIFDPKKGRDMEINRTGEVMANGRAKLSSIKYTVLPLSPSVIKVPNWQEDMKVLSNFIKFYSEDAIIQVLEAQIGDYLPVEACFRPARAVSRPTRRVGTPTPRKKAASKKKVVKKRAAGGRKVTSKKKVIRRKSR